MGMSETQVSFQEIVERAIQYLKAADFQGAKEQLQLAFALDMNAPQVHNLIGIMFELKHEESLAMRHYRASATLDGTYRPALENLYRLGTSDRKRKAIDYGSGYESLTQRVNSNR